MAYRLAPYTCVWPDPELHFIERRLHEIVEIESMPDGPELPTYGVINSLLHEIFKSQLPSPHVVVPRGPLLARLGVPQSSISVTPQIPSGHHISVDLSSGGGIGLEHHSSALGHSRFTPNDPANRSNVNVVNVGNNSGAVGDTFPAPPTPLQSAADEAMNEGLKEPGFLVYKANPNGRFTNDGGPDILRLVVDLKSGAQLDNADRLRPKSYFSRIREMGAAEAGVLLIVQGDAYFWGYDELLNLSDTDVAVPAELGERYSCRIDDWQFMELLMKLEKGEQGVRFGV
ncbi:unnamed protein product [Rhizoctonia solani]|uniref:Uncharacterized protein n=1 Tax=Rhizoctonia solani TaxID=456999 RepID=A0A8H3HWD1_9AGAM|nr:unnamed protein product [Rhizoctonia solani]